MIPSLLLKFNTKGHWYLGVFLVLIGFLADSDFVDDLCFFSTGWCHGFKLASKIIGGFLVLFGMPPPVPLPKNTPLFSNGQK